MKIRLVCVGKFSNPHLEALAGDYRERLRRLCDLEIVEVKDALAGDGEARLTKEAALILAKAGPLADCILWDENGEDMDSRAFSRFLERREAATKRLTMIIGSSHGIADSLKAAVPRKLRLSRFTFTHEWARALALEQLYRAYCIKKNLPYHH